MSEPPYTPIDCALHDELEAAATRGRPVHLAFRPHDGGAALRTVDDVIVDVGSRDGAEYLSLRSGLRVRLDRIVALNGIDFQTPRC